MKIEPMHGWVVEGFVHRGPDQSQGFQGWKVHAQPRSGIDVPVTLFKGHVQGTLVALGVIEEKENA